MPPQYPSNQQALEVIIRSPGTMTDDVVFRCPDLTWHQIFLTIDRLTREGALTMTPKGQGLYAVQVSDEASLGIPSLPAA